MTKRKTESEKLEALVEKTAPKRSLIRRSHQGVAMYNETVVNEIYDRVSQGQTLTSVCNDELMPTWMTVHRWMKQYPEFRELMAEARDLGQKFNLERVIDIADDVLTKDDVPAAKLQIETRMKLIKREDKRLSTPVDPKVIEAAEDKGGTWRVLDNGEKVNPIEEAINSFKRRKGLIPNET